jgi:ABC-type multidrug transport system ATPase subunit
MQDVSRGEGRTVLFVSHNMASVKALCKSGVLLENGALKYSGHIDDVVDMYINGNILVNDDVAFISNEKINQYRIKSDGTIHPIEIIEVERLTPFTVDSKSDLEFRIRLRNNEHKKNVQICTLIDDIRTDNRVGLTNTEEIILNESSHEIDIKLRVKSTNLTRGKYKLSFWVGTGDVYSSMHYYDRVFNSLTFEVSSILNKPVNMWYDDWGFTYFESKIDHVDESC